MFTDIWQSSATELAAAIRARRVSSREVVGAFLERISALDSNTNAFALVAPEPALKAAREADEAIARKDEALGPLHGVPVSVKDVIATGGMRTAYGSRMHADNIPPKDAEAVRRVRRAGGIVIGKTTTPEFAHKVLTDSPLYGVTRNPWDLERSPGGSSGGAAVAAAMGFCPLNISTDGAGSSRVPASCCGVIGLKPTMGSIPNENSPDLFAMQVLGAITRSAADLKLLFDTMAGPHPHDPFSFGMPAASLSRYRGTATDLKGLKVRYFPLMGNRQLDKQVRQAIDNTIALMTDAGAHVFEGNDLDWHQDAWRILLRAQQASRFRHSFASIKNDLDPSMAQCIEEGLSQNVVELQDALLARSDLYKQLSQVFDAVDVFISPVLGAPPLLATHKADDPLTIDGERQGSLRSAWYNYTAPLNGSGHPAISVPCGFTTDGLPIGMQIVGPWHSEALLLSIATTLEAIQPWKNKWPSLA